MSKKTLKDNAADICADLECDAQKDARITLMHWIKGQVAEKQKATLAVYDTLVSTSSTDQRPRTLGDVSAELEVKALSAKSAVDSLNIPKGKEDLAAQLIGKALSESWDNKQRTGQTITLADGVADPAMILSIQQALDCGSKPAAQANNPTRALECAF